ncbi:hypothetical protein ACHQM5_028204 [Ranunculus cassubicifolius]
MGKLVSEYQTSGIAGRQIQEGVLLANELLDSNWRNGKPGIIFKLDFFKAFDRVSWSFLLDILSKFGFGEKWKNWLKACWMSGHCSVLVNGVAHGNFTTSRGLRQGDPVSPMLFVLAMEVLSQCILKAQALDLIKGLNVKDGGIRVPILQYADDTLILIEGVLEDALNLKEIMGWFSAMSGLEVNYNKSVLYQINDVTDWELIVQGWECKIGVLPDLYLGMPLGSKFKSKVVWDPLLSRLREQLATWKRRFLSKGGRLILIQSTLLGLPTYLLSLLVIPNSVAEEIERLIRNFLWGNTDLKKKFSLVAWEEVCLPKQWGGLGLRKILELNCALLCKWLWLFSREPNKLWVRVISEKFSLEKGGWFTKLRREPYGCSMWRGIMRYKNVFEKLVRFSVGKGDRVRFWEDCWCLDVPLAVKYEGLYELSRYKGAFIKDCAPIVELTVDWNLGLRRRLPDHLVEKLAELLELLGCYSIVGFDHDQMLWEDGSKPLMVKTMVKCLTLDRLQEKQLGIFNFPDRRVWLNELPTKVSFFVWSLLRLAVLTQDKLQRRGFALANRCVFCKENEESALHLFFQCRKTKKIWSYFYASFGLVFDSSLSIFQYINKECTMPLSVEGAKYWSWLFHGIVWVIWLERNLRIFEGLKSKKSSLIDKVKRLLWEWGLNVKETRLIRLDFLLYNWHSVVLDSRGL